MAWLGYCSEVVQDDDHAVPLWDSVLPEQPFWDSQTREISLCLRDGGIARLGEGAPCSLKLPVVPGVAGDVLVTDSNFHFFLLKNRACQSLTPWTPLCTHRVRKSRVLSGLFEKTINHDICWLSIYDDLLIVSIMADWI